jgi:exosortase/archaeosortase family protein
MAEAIETTEDTDQPPPDTSGSGRRTNRRTLRFVVVFVLLVMSLLTGYRYAMNTVPNMWYLYEVANNTAWLLGLVGDSGEVEPWNRKQSPSKIRAELKAWNRGEELDPDSFEYRLSDPPLTAWEIWQYKAFSRIRNGEDLTNHGPTIRFIKKMGLSQKRQELSVERAQIEQDTALPEPDKKDKLTKIDAQLASLSTQEKNLPEGTARVEARNNTEFTFRVVPDCGAIPSMSIYIAAIIAFPALWRKKIIGAVFGLIALYGINVARLATLAYIGAIDPTPDNRWFNFIHEYVWQGIFLVFVVAIWMTWIEFVVRVRNPKHAGTT